MRCRERGVRVAGDDVIGGPRVVGAWAVSADPAVRRVVSNLFRSSSVVASVVGSVPWRSCPVVELFAAFAARDVRGELSAVETGSADRHRRESQSDPGSGWRVLMNERLIPVASAIGVIPVTCWKRLQITSQ